MISTYSRKFLRNLQPVSYQKSFQISRNVREQNTLRIWESLCGRNQDANKNSKEQRNTERYEISKSDLANHAWTERHMIH